MIDYILTALIPVLLALCVLWGNKKAENQNAFMNKDFSTMLKGACCIVVILVHIPIGYANKLQDGIGSFAYICVTLFFLMSAYGMNLCADRKPDYMKHFWRNRLAALLIPQILMNTSIVMYNIITHRGGYGSLVHINGYVLVLLEYRLWFYLVWIGGRWFSKRTSNILLNISVIVSSFIMYFYFDASGWCYERLGLVWGALLYLNFPTIKKFVKPNILKILVWSAASLFLGIAYLKFKPLFFWGEYLLKIELAIVIIILLFVLSSQRTWGNRAIRFLGGISYEVYLSHGFVMSVITYLSPNISSGVFILTTMFVTIIFSTIIHSIGKPLIRLCRIK